MKENKIIRKMNIIFFGLFFSCFYVLILSSYINGDDYWWHVKVGEWIANNNKAPTTGIYSWYALKENLNWFAHEWLAELTLYKFTTIFGEYGGLQYLFISLLSLGLVLYIANWKGYLKNIWFSLGLSLLGLFVIGSVSTARPHVFSFVLFALLLWTCQKIKQDNNYKLYLLFPIIGIIWSNFHGGSSNLLYIIPIMYFICNSFNFNIGRIESKRIKNNYKYLILALINTLSILINPRTYELILYPYSYTNEHAKYISEWRSTSFSDGGILALALIMIICLVLFSTKRKINFSDLALLGAFMCLTLKSIRFVAWLYIVVIFIIFTYIKGTKNRKINQYVASFSGTIGFMGLLFVLNQFNKPEETYITKSVPESAITILKETEYNNLYNDYNLGSYLIYRDIDVFIDGRADMYTGHNFDVAINLYSFTKENNYEEIINENDFDMFITESQSFLSYNLSNNENYNCLFEDDNVKIFKKVVVE